MGHYETQANFEGARECTQSAEGGIALTSLYAADFTLLDTGLIR
jgi:hypothetical protein